MQPAYKCTHGINEKGIVVVDGREYPMSSEVVATEDIIQSKVKAMAEHITAEYGNLTHLDTRPGAAPNSEAPVSYDNPLLILSVLKGSYIFTADMVRYLGDCHMPHVVDFVRLTSYKDGTKSSGTVTVLANPKFENFRGKHLLILEDVCDSGRTLHFFKQRVIDLYKPKSVRTLVLVDKATDARKVTFKADYKCIDAPNKYIIGYGFEVNDRYRDLRHIFVLKDGEEKKYRAKL